MKKRSSSDRSVVFVSLMAAVMLLGCASDVANRYYGDQHYPAKDPKEVQILRQRPSAPFEVIADFQSRGETPEDIREKAAKIGADAVIISILGGYYDRNEEWASDDKHNNTYTRITGSAIKFKK